MLVAGTVLWSLWHRNLVQCGVANPQNFLTKQGVACKWQAWKQQIWRKTKSPDPSSVRKVWFKRLNNQLTSFTELENWLVVSTHLKNVSKFGSFPQIGMKIKNSSNHHPEKMTIVLIKNHDLPMAAFFYIALPIFVIPLFTTFWARSVTF